MERTAGVVVDEAGCMERADLACVWELRGHPCLLAGDPRQLPPTVLSDNVADAHGNVYHRLVSDAKVSALEWLEASGVSVYRPKTQLRMARGLFDYVGELVYPQVGFSYGSMCNISEERFAPGRKLEAFVTSAPYRARPSPANTLLPVFIHCQDTEVLVSEQSTSRVAPGQVRAALDFLVKLVDQKKIDAAQITIISPYTGNVQLINDWLELPEFASLASMSAAMTVDSFQGREGDIVILVMGTNAVRGPGFTRDPHRLNVMATRQRCGLVIFGDAAVVGDLSGGPRDTVKYPVCGPDGETRNLNVTVVWNLLNRLQRDGRIVGRAVVAGLGRGGGPGGGGGARGRGGGVGPGAFRQGGPLSGGGGAVGRGGVGRGGGRGELGRGGGLGRSQCPPCW